MGGGTVSKIPQGAAGTLTYVAYEGEELCGFVRTIDDAGLYIYVCDLLVTPAHRGKSIGKKCWNACMRIILTEWFM